MRADGDLDVIWGSKTGDNYCGIFKNGVKLKRSTAKQIYISFAYYSKKIITKRKLLENFMRCQN